MATQQEQPEAIRDKLGRETSHKDSSNICISLRSRSKEHCDICQHSSRKQTENQSFFRGENYQIHQNLISTNSCSCLPRNCYDNFSYLTLCCVQLEKHDKVLFNGFEDFLQQMKLRNDRLSVKNKEETGESGVANNTDEMLKNAFDSLVEAVKNMVDATAKGGADISSSVLTNTAFKSRLFNSRSENSNEIGNIELKKLRTSYETNWMKNREKNVYKNLIRRNFTAGDFNGLRCKTNRTVNFFHLDIEIHKKMVRNLGLNREHIKKMTTLALVDVKVSFFQVFHLEA